MTTATKSYNAESIQVLEGLDPVRKRPGMYIGGTGSTGLHHLVWEVLDNAIDEAMNGHASQIDVTLHKDGSSVSVSDNGRGMPVDIHPKHKKSALELIFGTLHAGGKFDNTGEGNYKTSGGLHGVGASVVNALSKQLVATVKKDGTEWRMEFSQGKTKGKLQKLGPARGTGTTVYFHPDAEIFPKIDFNPDTIRERIEVASYIHKGVKFTFTDQTKEGKAEVFHHDEGIVAFFRTLVKEKNAKPVHEQPFSYERNNGTRIEVVFGWTESTDELVRSYVNGIPTGNGGTHENGLRAGIMKAVRNYIETHNLTPRGVSIAADDIREGVFGVLSVFIADPQFQGQTKDRLNNAELQSVVDGAVRPQLEQWLNENRSVAEMVVARIIAAAKAREASRAASAAVSRKTATSGRLNLPGKLSDCTNSNRQDSELFIVEGDSAGGSAKQGRDRTHQAILPLRGKVLNTHGLTAAKVMENKEITDLATALGCGIGRGNVDVARLRYQRIILLADADSDGHHITTLLLAFFYNFLPELIKEGKVFLAVPPLYRIDIGKETYWATDDADKERILRDQKRGSANASIQRFKGLGEMDPKVLWETTLNPRTRRLLKVEIPETETLSTLKVMDDLMGKDPAPRFSFIMERADEADELDL